MEIKREMNFFQILIVLGWLSLAIQDAGKSINACERVCSAPASNFIIGGLYQTTISEKRDMRIFIGWCRDTIQHSPCSTFSSPEATIGLLISFKNGDLWPSPTMEVPELRTHCQIGQI